MVSWDNFRILNDEEKVRYKFEFCEGCALYDECELVEEFVRFRDNHPPIHKSQTPQAPGGVLKVKATAVRIGDRATAPLQSLVGSATDSPVRDAVSYNQQAVKDGCIMSSRHVFPIACGRQRVTEGIGDHYQIEIRKDYTLDIVTGAPDRWEPSQPVFISAQTGQGKNYFIENELIPYVDELNYRNNTDQKVLILSNRLALQEQVKNRLAGKPEPKNEGKEIYHPFGGCADVITHQGLLHQEKRLRDAQKEPHSRYIYVICDEAHFFTSDAMFNPHTSKILSAIVRLFQDAIRVYMSATPYDCLEYIIKYEREYRSRLNFNRPQYKDKSIPMVFYHFERDYSYLDVKAYSSIDELYEQIVDSVNRWKEKWLIFIDDKQKGATVKAKLLEYEREHAEKRGWSLVLNGGAEESVKGEKEKDANAKAKAEAQAKRILVVSADSKNDETYTSIVLNEKLGKDTYVLITTSVLDNGVNLTDISNIVISDMAKVKCLQMVGRARVSGKDGQKTLYIKRFGGSEVSERLRHFKKQRKAYQLYNLAYGESHDWTRSRKDDIDEFINKYYHDSDDDWHDAKHWFGHPVKDSTKLYFNEIAKSLLDRLIPQYQSIDSEMRGEGPKKDEPQARERVNRTGQKYLEYQLSWFGKTYCEEDDITFADRDKAKKTFMAFLESYADSGTLIACEADRIKFQSDFTELYCAVFGPLSKNKVENKGTGGLQMNRALKDKNIGYKIAGKQQAGPWTVVRYDWEDERS